MYELAKYKQNLSIVKYDDDTYIQSYSTRVAKIDLAQKTAQVLGWWSQTTSKHINYACKELGLTIIKGEDHE